MPYGNTAAAFPMAPSQSDWLPPPSTDAPQMPYGNTAASLSTAPAQQAQSTDVQHALPGHTAAPLSTVPAESAWTPAQITSNASQDAPQALPEDMAAQYTTDFAQIAIENGYCISLIDLFDEEDVSVEFEGNVLMLVTYDV
ncbi:hypothetical protein AURDEDRAFT_125916 [Auricularia subglabra TFB-10046 SS5]|nr:hypothetical protein AURDEDRAFT_125916 [Auricularia subglabra TFB-10046 SS5]